MSTLPSDYASSPALPSPPFVNISGIPNFRDLGGYRTHSPKHSIRTNVIYRCAEPSQITQEGVEKLNELGVKKIYDLRSEPEIERAVAAGRGGIVELDGCERVFAPVFRTEDYSPEGVALRFKSYAQRGTEGFTKAYTEILESGPPAYRTILLHIAHEPNAPLILHCTAGKDRTGVLCAVILSLCGVDDETICQEYNLTEQGLPLKWRQSVIAHLMENAALKGNEEGAWNLISAKAENMAAFLKAMRERVGGAEAYVIEKCGLTTEEVEMIRMNLIVEKPALHGKM